MSVESEPTAIFHGVSAGYLPEECWYVEILWRPGFHSPAIGPFLSNNEAEHFAKAIRKKLRSAGHPVNGMVHTYQMASPELAMGWGLHA